MKLTLAAALIAVVALPVHAEPLLTPPPADPFVLTVGAQMTTAGDDAVAGMLERIESDPAIRSQADEEAAYPINSF